MHDVIQNELEDYLGGSASRPFQAHLDKCRGCREELRAMQDVSGLFGALQNPPELDGPAPTPGFYYLISQRLETQRRQSLWSVFTFDPAFARRLVFSSLMALTVLGSYLVSRESAFAPASENPAAIMARHDSSVQHEDGNDRGRMLVTLASYEH